MDELIARARLYLYWWDAWCADDGRVAAALATAVRFEDTYTGRIALAQAIDALVAAHTMICAAPPSPATHPAYWIWRAVWGICRAVYPAYCPPEWPAPTDTSAAQWRASATAWLDDLDRCYPL